MQNTLLKLLSPAAPQPAKAMELGTRAGTVTNTASPENRSSARPILFLNVLANGVPLNREADYTAQKNWPRVIALSYAFYSTSGEELFFQYQLIRPDGFAISAHTASQSGISHARALKEGFPIKEVLQQFDREVKERRPQLVVAHNLDRFHRPVLYAEFFWSNLFRPFVAIPKWCSMVGTTDFCGLIGVDGLPKWPSLTELHHILFGTKLSGRGNPGHEVRTCAACYFELERRSNEGPRRHTPQLRPA
jgi:DNA polymerase-3 subunit alpha